jgi:hypothetical protein
VSNPLLIVPEYDPGDSIPRSKRFFPAGRRWRRMFKYFYPGLNENRFMPSAMIRSYPLGTLGFTKKFHPHW